LQKEYFIAMKSKPKKELSKALAAYKEYRKQKPLQRVLSYSSPQDFIRKQKEVFLSKRRRVREALAQGTVPREAIDLIVSRTRAKFVLAAEEIADKSIAGLTIAKRLVLLELREKEAKKGRFVSKKGIDFDSPEVSKKVEFYLHLIKKARKKN
jgi:hypothetical protein